MLLFSSCTSSKINSPNDLHGAWVSRYDQPVYSEFGRQLYYQFIFKNDSFSVEIGILDEDTDINYRPFKAIGTYTISRDYIVMNGMAKAEGSSKFSMNYYERFTYDYSTNYLSLFSNDRSYLIRYDLIRRSPVVK